jgi:SNF2 family DNA or RNA helicase
MSHKAVLFCPLPGQTHLVDWWFRTYHPRIQSFLLAAGQATQERTDVINAFSDWPEPAVLVLTPALGGTGLNLTAADHVVIMQKFWCLNEQRQAVARVHRLGQPREPTAWVLHVKGGIDDRAQELQTANGVFEARMMHGLMGTDISYNMLMSVISARMAHAVRQQ